MKTIVPALPALALAVALTGCGAADDTAEKATEPGASAPEVPTAARAAVDDLTAELGVSAADLESVEVEPVTWSDSSLGCATKGEMYTQATVDGHRITLVVAGDTYEYHDGGDRDAFLCEDPTE